MGASVPWHAYGGQRASLGVNPHLPPCLRQGLLFTAANARLPGLQAPGDFSGFTARLTVGVLGLHVFHLIWIYEALGIQTLFLMMCGEWFIPWDSFSVPVMRLTYADILIGIHIPKRDSTEIPHLCELVCPCCHVTQAACEHACPYHQGMVLGHGIHENKHTHTTT